MSTRKEQAFEVYKELVRAAFAAAHVQAVHDGTFAVAMEFEPMAAMAFDAVDAFDEVAATDDN